MGIVIEVPEDVARQLEAHRDTEGLTRKALEALTVEAYRSGVITGAQVQRVLGFSSRWETEAFLKQARAYLDYIEEDLQQDIETLRQALPR